jgi:hypothetical protein
MSHSVVIVPRLVLARTFGPSTAELHERVRASLRPVASALVGLIINFIGFGLSPLLVGLWGALHSWLAGCQLGRSARREWASSVAATRPFAMRHAQPYGWMCQ